MYNEVITLISETVTVNQYGDMVKAQTRRQVFAKLTSVGFNEFYQAQAVGLKPELKFVLPDYLEYDGEKIVEYAEYSKSAELFTVLRTYRTESNELELVVRRGID